MGKEDGPRGAGDRAVVAGGDEGDDAAGGRS